jgi:mannan endo-1,4-beta-mannosidase
VNRGLKTFALAALATVASAAPASACLTVGVYQDNPTASLASLQRSAGHGISLLSTYLTAGQALPRSVIKTANRNHVGLLVTWEPDGGTGTPIAPHYRLTDVAHGRYDASLRALVKQLRKVRDGAVLRPMPEMNTPWYAWSGTVNGNTPANYIAAWKRVRRAVRSAPGGRKIRMLWAPYAQSIPATGTNQLGDYFPGASQVDVVGVSGYNFGSSGSLSWTTPEALFASAYGTIESIAVKPFWLAETGSTADGGDQAGWIGQLAALPETMPQLSGLLWYDVNDPTGDFRLRGAPVRAAFHSLLKEACR